MDICTDYKICPDYQIGIISSRYRNLNGDIRIAETIIILKKKENNNIKGQDYLWDECGAIVSCISILSPSEKNVKQTLAF